jgi:hypothetical protein
MHSAIALAALSGLALLNAQAVLGAGTIDGPVIPGTTGKLGNAPITTSNPAGVTYTAVLPNRNTTGVRGYVSATSNANGTGVLFNVNLYGFPDALLGPFCKSTIRKSNLSIAPDAIVNSVPHPRPASPS